MGAAAGYAGLFVLLVAAAIAAHHGLDAAGLAHGERYLGIAGTAMIAVSFVYSLRKRKIVTFGKAPVLLRLHSVLAWTGAMLVLVHAGARFQSLLPVAAAASMLVVVASGLTGRYLLQRGRQGLKERRRALAEEGLGDAEIDARVFWEALVVDAMNRWRSVHLPLTVVFAVLAALHIATALMFWRW